MNINKKKVLITGSEGFIGSHLTEKLVKLGANVTCFVKYNFISSYGFLEELSPTIRSKIKIIMGDLIDYDAVLKACSGKDVVFHLGALISIPYSYDRPLENLYTNVIGTFNVMNACKIEKVKKVIHTSTSEVYGSAQYIPIDEKHPLVAQSPYSASKISADKIAESFYLSYDLPVATIRPFNTYGPRQSARAVIPTIITQALSSNIISLGSIQPERDFTFVEDTVEGFVKISESDKSIGEVINIGNGVSISIGDLAQKIIKIVNPKAKIVLENKRKRPQKSEVNVLLADVSKAKKIIGWNPKYSLDNGLKKTIIWIKQNKENYKIGEYIK